MYNIVVCLVDVLVALVWGDWRNWRNYQSSILYLIVCDLIYNLLTYNHPLWEYKSTLPILNHTILNMITMFVAYPSIMLVYLGRFPTKRMKQIIWGGFWVSLWSFLEWVSIQLGNFSYLNGWNFIWSFLFNIVLFSMVRLHYKMPLLTYGLSFILAVVLLSIFDVPFEKMK